MKQWMFGLVAALLLGGCGRPAIRPVTPDTVVLAFGDSLTEGYGVEPSESYPSVLGTLLGCKVVNAGVSGEVSEQGVRRLPSVLEKFKPSLVVICHGGNDFLRGVRDDEVERNLQTMVAAVRAAGADAVLVGVPRAGLILRASPVYARVAKENGLLCDIKTVPYILSTASLKSDAIHPDADGNRCLAEAVAKLLRK